MFWSCWRDWVDSHKWVKIKCFKAVWVFHGACQCLVCDYFIWFNHIPFSHFAVCHRANFWCLVISTHTWNYCQNPDMNKPEKNLKLVSEVMCQGGFFHKIVDSDFKLFWVGTKKHGRAKRATLLLGKALDFSPLLSFSFNLFLVCIRILLPVSVNQFLSFPSSF